MMDDGWMDVAHNVAGRMRLVAAREKLPREARYVLMWSGSHPTWLFLCHFVPIFGCCGLPMLTCQRWRMLYQDGPAKIMER